MENENFIIDRDRIQSLRSRISSSDQYDICIQELQRMIEIKSGICWRADARANCCGADLSLHLYAELQFLEKALDNLQSGNLDTVDSLLELYETNIPSTQ